MNSDASTATAEAPRRLAADLLEIGAVLLRPETPFTWSSGLKAPIYCDHRLTLAHPPIRRRIAEGFAALVERHVLAPEVVAGTATAGIPHAAWLADRLALPMAYVRTSKKEHGRENLIEGRVASGQRVVLIEDLVSTGRSACGAAQALRAAGAEVPAVLAIFSYGLEAARQHFAAADLPLHTLTDFDVLLAVAQAQRRLTDAQFETLRLWQRDPQAWSERQ